MTDRVHRVTLLKIPKPDEQKIILDQYRKLATDNKKVTIGTNPTPPLRSPPRIDRADTDLSTHRMASRTS